MATTVNSTRLIAQMAGAGSGTLAWVLADVDVAVDDTFIDAAAIINFFQGTAAGGRIIQVFDGGGDDLVLTGAATGLTLTQDPGSGEGNITFRNSLTGAVGAAIAATTNLELQLLIRF